MTTSFYNGINGFKSFQSGIDIWGDNIANINTPGYKASIPEFATVFYNSLQPQTAVTSDIGVGGSYLNSTSKDISVGELVNTDNPFDLSITDDNGFFAVSYKGGKFYTRNGSFSRNSDGFLVNDDGAYLLVSNANNLKKVENGYIIDRNIKTDKLLPSDELTSIKLPNDVILPSIPTSKITFQTNLSNDERIFKAKFANIKSDFSALYDKYKKDMHVRKFDSFIFGFGNNAVYKDNVIESEFCIEDDEKDGKNVKIDFTINGKKIKLMLPDGATKKQIISKLSEELTKNHIINKPVKNGIKIYDEEKIIISSNDNIIPNTAIEKLIYYPSPIKENHFSTIEEFNKLIQNLLNVAYPNLGEVKLEDGKIKIFNKSSNQTIHSYILKTERSNEDFLNNLNQLGNDIYPNTASSSFEFLLNSQKFGGELYDNIGNKDKIEFIFTKKKVLENKTYWNVNIEIKDEKNKVIHSEERELIFNSQGNLISSPKVTISKPQNIEINFNITTFNTTNIQVPYSYSQNGVSQGYLTHYEIDDNGYIKGVFTNNKDAILGQIPIYHFQNPQGLDSIGNSLFKESSNSNKAFLYLDAKGEYIPTKIKSYTLEQSNVSFNEAMTQLIINQKAFQASAKTVTTSNEMIQKAINLKRS